MTDIDLIDELRRAFDADAEAFDSGAAARVVRHGFRPRTGTPATVTAGTAAGLTVAAIVVPMLIGRENNSARVDQPGSASETTSAPSPQQSVEVTSSDGRGLIAVRTRYSPTHPCYVRADQIVKPQTPTSQWAGSAVCPQVSDDGRHIIVLLVQQIDGKTSVVSRGTVPQSQVVRRNGHLVVDITALDRAVGR